MSKENLMSNHLQGYALRYNNTFRINQVEAALMSIFRYSQLLSYKSRSSAFFGLIHKKFLRYIRWRKDGHSLEDMKQNERRL